MDRKTWWRIAICLALGFGALVAICGGLTEWNKMSDTTYGMSDRMTYSTGKQRATFQVVVTDDLAMLRAMAGAILAVLGAILLVKVVDIVTASPRR